MARQPWINALAAALALAATPALLGAPGGFEFTAGTMNVHRSHPAVVKMSDGRVLIAGGYTTGGARWNTATATAEVFDPSTGQFTPTGSMSTPRGVGKGVLLPDGRVLVAGGQTYGGGPWNTAEVYDPNSGTFSPASNAMNGGRVWPLAVRTTGGQVVVGFGCCSGAQTADVFDPGSATFGATAGAPFIGAETGTMTLLQDDRVLVAGGWSGPAAQVYDPAARSFSATGSMTCTRTAAVAVRLQDGRVLLAGGTGSGTAAPCDTASAEIWDPGTSTWTMVAGTMSTHRLGAWATVLPDGKVLVAGGSPTWGGTPTDSADVFDPSTGQFTPTGSLGTARRQWGTTDTVTLDDGRILLVGGAGLAEPLEGPLNTSELYTLGSATPPAPTPSPPPPSTPEAPADPGSSPGAGTDPGAIGTTPLTGTVEVRDYSSAADARARIGLLVTPLGHHRVLRRVAVGRPRALSVTQVRFERGGRFSFYLLDRNGRRVPLSPGSRVGSRVLGRTFYAPVVQRGKAGRSLRLRLRVPASRRSGWTMRVVHRSPLGVLTAQEISLR